MRNEILASLAMSLAAMASTAAAAQSAPEALPADDAVSNDAGEIVVTAQRRAERLQDVPISASVISGDQLEERGIKRIEDLSAQVPNLKVTRQGSADQLHVRGTGSGFNGGFEQSVATFVDGVYRSRARAINVALFDIERVEVLKGPQTTFFGANAIAGALNITTRRPTGGPAVNGTILYSPTTGEYNFEAGVSAPITDTLDFRVAGRASGMDGYIKNDRGGEGPDLDDLQGRVSLLWRPASRVEVFARYDVARLRDKGVFNYEILNCPGRTGTPTSAVCSSALAQNGGSIGGDKLDYRSYAAQSGLLNLDMQEALLTTRIGFDSVDLVFSTSYSDQDVVAYSDTAAFPGVTINNTPAYSPTNATEYSEQFSQEVRLESAGDGPFSYMLGAYFERAKLRNIVFGGLYSSNLAPLGGGLIPAGTPIAINWNTDQLTHTYSGFGSVTYDLTDKLILSAGLRYSYVEKEASRTVGAGTGGPLITNPDNYVPAPAAAQAALLGAIRISTANFGDPRRSDDAFMPSANIRYKITPDANIYASYTRGFKAGGYGYVSPDSFNPEHVNAYEVGFKGKWMGGKLGTNLALFRSDYSGLQEAQNTSNDQGIPIQIIGNAGKSRAQGAEFNLTLQATDALYLFADVAYLDSKYISYANAPCNPVQAVGVTNCTQDLSGKTRPYAPKWSGSAGAEYRLDLGSDLELTFGGQTYFSSRYFQQTSLGDLVAQSGFAKIDARVGLAQVDDRWSVSVIGRNLTDRTTASVRSFSSGAVGSVAALTDPPRTVAFQLSFKFR